MKRIEDLKIKIFCDGAKMEDFISMGRLPYIKGFTTNPSLMKKAGVTNYEKFVSEILPVVGNKPISLEVISDDFPEMKRQALKLSSFGKNIYVKIPIMNTKAESSISLISELVKEGVKLNITAVMTLEQVKDLSRVLISRVPTVVSIFAGRIADTGVDPIIFMKKARSILKSKKGTELLWASPRELLNIFQAEETGCDIITVLPEILKKIPLVGYGLHEFSLDTVKMFYNDAVSSGLEL